MMPKSQISPYIPSAVNSDPTLQDWISINLLGPNVIGNNQQASIDYSRTVYHTHSHPIDSAPITIPPERNFLCNQGSPVPETLCQRNASSTAEDEYLSPLSNSMTLEQQAFVSDPCFKTKLLPHAHQEHLRQVLCAILSASWWCQNEPEPEGVFSPFIEILSHHQYKCIFCTVINSRMDRAVAHCRKHLHHRPFYCNGEKCKSGPGACGSRFFTRECLTAHRKHHIITCTTCATPVEEKNLRRHKKSKRCSTTPLEPSGLGLNPVWNNMAFADAYYVRS